MFQQEIDKSISLSNICIHVKRLKNVQKQGTDGRDTRIQLPYILLYIFIIMSLLIPISSSYSPRKLHSPLRDSITLVFVMQ